MSDLPVFFTALAEEDLDQIEDYISAHDPAAAARVRAAIVQQSLQHKHPDISAIASTGYTHWEFRFGVAFSQVVLPEALAQTR
jgi:hypothetical protein